MGGRSARGTIGGMLLTVGDFEAAAADLLGAANAAFVSGAAGEGRTRDANEAAFDAIRLLPKVLVDVSDRSTKTSVLGHEIELPVILAPSAMHRISHADGERATARAAAAAGTIMVLSLGSSLPVEDVMTVAAGPVWFQAYVGKDRVRTAEVIHRARAAGCTGLVVTVDAPVVGGRVAERRHGFEVLPEWFAPGHEPFYGLIPPAAAGAGATELWDPSLTWGDIEWLRGLTDLPLMLKGILRADDAVRAVAEGADAVIVSNHGGRQLDSVVASIDALPKVRDAVGDSATVMVDGGIRRGGDVFKALTQGADAVLVGRPVMWGLAVRGQSGVEQVLRHLAEELELTMALCGARTVAEITPDLVLSS